MWQPSGVKYSPLIPLLCLAVFPAQSQELSATLGKQRAASSPLEWEVRDAGHPTLGSIRFAVLKRSVETPVLGGAKVYSRAYVSCQKQTRRFAIELTNAMGPDDPGGLQPKSMPRLVCTRPNAPGDAKLVQEELTANWEVSAIGDTLARGFRAFPLRECVGISVMQELMLPQGLAQRTARFEFEIAPYSRDLDAIFVACGETSAYAPSARGAPVTAAAPRPPVARTNPAQGAETGWQAARATARGKSNVRGGPSTQSEIVVTLDPGAVILVQRVDGEWWRVKPSRGNAFEGYIRQDRIVFK